jgi:spermidine synthase
LLGALFLSGIAAIINQTVWQRALKIYLAGAESISAMIVVMTFMLGLGLGSLYMGLRAHRIRNPMRELCFVEIALAVVNIIIAVMLSLNISESVYSFQKFAASLGLPLRFVYGFSSMVVLFVPCFLMGLTMPLVSEAAQKQLGNRSSSFITILFVFNTLGSVLGGLLGGFCLMPYLGQNVSLAVAVACNLTAGVLILGICCTGTFKARKVTGEAMKFKRGRFEPEEVMGFWLGFLSLGYEMYLFRIVAIAHEPLPINFSLVLCSYLFFWSVGIFLAKRMREGIAFLLVLSALLVAVMPGFHVLDRELAHLFFGKNTWFLIIFTLPCVPFGALFGQILARYAKQWGNDVGRYYGMNTIGSGFGIMVITFIGFEYNHAYTVSLIGLGYVGILIYYRKHDDTSRPSRLEKLFVPIGLLGVAVTLAISIPAHIVQDVRPDVFPHGRTTYFGKDGVIEITKAKDMIWNGLWHSALSENDNHIGSNNWLLATVPFLCHEKGGIFDSLVVGLGTGITVGTLARSEKIKNIDVYEINYKINKILRDYPDGTLRVKDNLKINIMWHDGRSGLALSGKKYDLVTQQPLYLKQAGSSILLSREYMELVRSRLKKKGIFCVYSNAQGNQEQALLVRKTVSTVFRYCESFGQGYMIVASNEPFTYDIVRLELAKKNEDPLVTEIRNYGIEKMIEYFDDPRIEWEDCPYIITDNHPLVEHPAIVQRLILTYKKRKRE